MNKQIVSAYGNEKKKSKKILIIPLMVVFAIGMVFAIGYLVNSLTLTIGVAEPFTIRYAVIGDASTYTEGTCANLSLAWFTSTSTSIPTGDFYPNESRLVCVEITNAGEVTIPYTIDAVVTNDDGTKCANAFGLPTILIGNASNGVNYNGKIIQIKADAVPISKCNVEINVVRG